MSKLPLMLPAAMLRRVPTPRSTKPSPEETQHRPFVQVPGDMQADEKGEWSPSQAPSHLPNRAELQSLSPLLWALETPGGSNEEDMAAKSSGEGPDNRRTVRRKRMFLRHADLEGPTPVGGSGDLAPELPAFGAVAAAAAGTSPTAGESAGLTEGGDVTTPVKSGQGGGPGMGGPAGLKGRDPLCPESESTPTTVAGSSPDSNRAATPTELVKPVTSSGGSCRRRRLADVYEVETAVVGQGGFGTVRRARLRGAPTVVRAVKTVWKRNIKAVDLVRREIAILRQLDHPCICRIFESFEDEKAITLVLEFVDGRELFDEIVDGGLGHDDEGGAAGVMRQVFSALQYCHERNVIHRDLKPDNIMVQRPSTPCPTLLHMSEVGDASPMSQASSCDMEEAPAARRRHGAVVREVKVIDFGLAVMSTRPVRVRPGSNVVGTLDYLAPEARKGQCVPPSDLWSAGVVLHAMLVGELPHSLGEATADGGPDLSLAEGAGVSPQALDLLRGLLQVDPAKRMTAAAAACHPWVTTAAGFREVTSPSCLSSPRSLRPLEEGLLASMAAFASFHRSAKVRRAALTAVAMQMTGKQLGGLREQFLRIDSDGNGRISREELIASVASAAKRRGGTGGTEDVKAWVEAMFDSVDTDGSQEIEYTEWLAATLQEQAYRSEEALRAAFRIFDSDGDGGIDQRELGRLLAESPEEIAALLPQFDSNGDGKIDFAEFKAILDLEAPGKDFRAAPGRTVISL